MSSSSPPCSAGCGWNTLEHRPASHKGSSPGSPYFSDYITGARLWGTTVTSGVLFISQLQQREHRAHVTVTAWTEGREATDAGGRGRRQFSPPLVGHLVSSSPGVPERWPRKSCLYETCSRLDRGPLEIWRMCFLGRGEWAGGTESTGQRITGLGVTSAGTLFCPVTSSLGIEAQTPQGALSGTRRRSWAGPGPCPLAVGFTSSVVCLAVWSEGNTFKAWAFCLWRGYS